MEESQIYGQQNFNLPHDVVKLPSGGVYYKSKKKSLKVGYLNASDENILMGGVEQSNNLMMTLLRNKIYEPEIKPEELLQGDIQAILIFLRNTAFGPEYNFILQDPETGKNFEGSVSLEELDIRKPEVDPDDNGFFEIKLPKTGHTLKVKPLTFSELDELDKMAEKYPVGRIAPKQTWKLNKMVVEFNGNIDKLIISQNLDLLPISDVKYIRKFVERNEPGLDLRKQVIAPSGKKLYVDIAFGVEFFRPFF